ncbi:peptidylprolyl isomerase [Desulfuromonas acetoxidans]|uniref:Peptidyl-prolyl cis-trans isomerase n=1 Tax=Desulfuromonas acetoxidans (strain DSM 684 / 11070) TaxID=281689 RepID=Q1JY87_DESA6|nr:peptidylprolyl isomerase [Desulfuromonas acetoxidans]EAT15109.1 peptidyl-prolyl cis-trans isomerase, cyclophilin type [Desulfuromonas acetoxidans DSM 684]MBF0643936.1 peptidylprolyl isomerase [Desulfuromonas acetoxidans]NVD23174.1 peptidylprolyl isomerase [Desulfuromonas acetoxidans]NVE15585.1 peptidylprolyl isomerase [Desulfuromonas acetoxidans]
METSPKVSLETTQGTIVLELDAEKAPITVENFLNYVRNNFYQDTIFHRVIPGFMIQGGGMNAAMEEEHGKTPIKNEADNGLKNLCGTIAMARTQVVDSATSQFFINVNDNDFLNHRDPRPEAFGYAVFGKVVEGMDVVRTIEKVPTGNKGHHQDVPLEPITIVKASVIED